MLPYLEVVWRNKSQLAENPKSVLILLMHFNFDKPNLGPWTEQSLGTGARIRDIQSTDLVQLHLRGIQFACVKTNDKNQRILCGCVWECTSDPNVNAV